MVLKTVLTVVSLLVATAALANVAADNANKITVCHVPDQDPEKAHTIRISRSAWPSHERQGHHQGACTAADKDPDNIPAPPAPRPTRLALEHESEADVDGDATFDVFVSNLGSVSGSGVVVEGRLIGDEHGKWTIRAPGSAHCEIDDALLTCDIGSLAVGKDLTLRLNFDGRPSVCEDVGINLVLSAANDLTTDDNRARETVQAGACSALEDTPTATPSMPLA